jgi:hypothetical protein
MASAMQRSAGSAESDVLVFNRLAQDFERVLVNMPQAL